MSQRPAPVPASTYRFQLTSDFTLFDAAEQIPYLAGLGIDWVYLSPVLAAEPGSTHGYDMVDPTRVDEARGGRAGLEALSRAAHAAGMGVLVDIVPNHMGVATPVHNRYWWDLLTFGEASRYAQWFDVDWAAGADDTAPFRPADGWTRPATGKLVLAELGAPEHLGELEIREHEGSPVLAYYDNLYPVAPGSLQDGMTPQELHAVQNYRLVHWKHEDWGLNYRRFFSIKTLAGIRVEDPAVFAATHREIASWFTEGLVDGLRIDHIDGLARPEEYLTRLTHLTGAYIVTEKILALESLGARELLPAGWAEAGARGTTGYELIAYIDGALTDRAGFFHLEAARQQLFAGGPLPGEAVEGADAAEEPAGLAAAGRHLQRHPTSVHGLFTQIEQAAKTHFAFGPLSGEMLRLARELKAIGWFHCDARSRAVIGADPLDIDIEQLADVFGILAASLPVYRVYRPAPTDREHFLAQLSDTVDTVDLPPLSEDGQIIMRALSAIRSTARSATASDRLLAYLGVVLTTANHPTFIRFAQSTGAIMAKGVEDTTFYRYAALTALNEVGGRPEEPFEPAALWQEFERRMRTTPHGLNSLSTHDTKRSEDTRARILALAELPGEFFAFLAAARQRTSVRYRPDESDLMVTAGARYGVNASIERTKAPLAADTSFDILLWQAVLGAWPATPERLTEYALKAAREQSLYTWWTDNHEEFEDELRAAMEATEQDPELRALIEDMDGRIRAAGHSNGLVAKALQLLAPGVPDVYQGTELWDRSLVDPDNRRPVDYGERGRHLGGIDRLDLSDEAAWDSGAVKLLLTSRLLHLRTRLREVFVPDSPLLTGPPGPVGRTGAQWEHALAVLFGGRVLLVGTRLPIGLAAAGGWADTAVTVAAEDLRPLDEDAYLAQVLAETDPDRSTDDLPADDPGTSTAGTTGSAEPSEAPAPEAPCRWRDVLTGAEFTGTRLQVAELLDRLPVAVLERVE
ncbi:alpha-amylase family glycosyl hydrolase [Brevibacterium sp. R8603A2]|uniref:alpha-amylase family glycosyl hydrolase n=1 Tax=Brevibacterium sp. R8603A2 TaxID=2929779 RepID=UPI001FF911AB|nr:alpha-amylase family glycosyl hydrolase [Brevibacterium sp. R8603A2]MCK1802972.1 alpha-amylase family glycosyl hydrolase [Brevibacterium sp. R8603A2]